MNIYEEIEKLQAQYEKEYKLYQIEMINKKAEYEKACAHFNDQINVINPERHAMRNELYDLHEFLGLFGLIGVNITPFDFSTEDSNYGQEIFTVSRKNVADTSQFEDMISANIKRSAILSASTLGVFSSVSAISTPFLPVLGPISFCAPLLVNILSKSEQREKYNDALKSYSEQRMTWEKSKNTTQELICFMNDATSIADTYRSAIVIIRDFVRHCILPELNSVLAFLYADSISTAIVNDEPTSELSLANILELQGTKYQEYYEFVKNAFEYYLMIKEFYLEPILTNIIGDAKINEKEREDFLKKVNAIMSKMDELQ